jgi:hypothetical protein
MSTDRPSGRMPRPSSFALHLLSAGISVWHDVRIPQSYALMCLLVDYRGLYYLSCIMLYHVVSWLVWWVAFVDFFLKLFWPREIDWVGRFCVIFFGVFFLRFFLICFKLFFNLLFNLFHFLSSLWWSSIVSKCRLKNFLFQLVQFIHEQYWS